MKKKKRKNGSSGPEDLSPMTWIGSEISGDVQIISDEGAYTYSEDNMAVDEKDNYRDHN